MTNSNNILPFYAKATIFLAGLFVLVGMLYIAQSIIIPIIFAIIIAILLQPVVDFLTRLKINRVVAIAITLLVTILLLVALGAFLVSQLTRFSESWPLLVERFTQILNQSITWIAGNFDINQQKIEEWILTTKNDLIHTSGTAIGQTLVNMGTSLVIIFLVPVYIFMILYYQPLLMDFIGKLAAKNHKLQVREIVTQSKTVIQRYLVGLVIEAAIVATLDATALFILGIEYAILLGILGALLNVIPYIGGLVAVALPMMIAIATKSSAWYALYVLAAYYFIQLVDNNYIVPKIVASKVKINALFSIIVVIAGNALWGIPGMFLSIPILAIMKLIFDHIEPLKPWGFLLGDTMPGSLKIVPILKKIIHTTK